MRRLTDLSEEGTRRLGARGGVLKDRLIHLDNLSRGHSNRADTRGRWKATVDWMMVSAPLLVVATSGWFNPFNSFQFRPARHRKGGSVRSGYDFAPSLVQNRQNADPIEPKHPKAGF